tara:strand:- start:206 stop:694 length:489 start_codon:yes stop_codon:yes gene_type:complete
MALTKVIGSGIGTVTNQFADGNLPAGAVLQILQQVTSGEVASTSSSYVDTGLTLAITPSSATSKIFILYTLHQFINATGASSNLKLLRGSSSINETGYMLHNGGSVIMGQGTHHFLDTPETTSELTYKVQFTSVNNSATVYCTYDDSAGNASSFLTLMEIAA